MFQEKEYLRLKKGSHIAVIGGGPSGSLFAFFAQKFARKIGLDVHITIYDGKDFSQAGPAGCNLCAGVISETLVSALNRDGITLPAQKIRRSIKGYYHVHSSGTSFIDPPRKSCTIYTVFRGNGPRFARFDGNVSFDDFLLQCAAQHGVEVVRASVVDFFLPENKREKARLVIRRNGSIQEVEADLVVGAFGLNSKMITKLPNMGFGYQPPEALTSLHAEIPLIKNKIKKIYQDRIGVFSLQGLQNLRFGVVTPKSDFLTISLVGKKDVHRDVLSQFLCHPQVKNIFNDPASIPFYSCQCRPKLPIGPSKKPYTDRLVIIGDASFSRHFKNGIYSAFITAKLAAMTALYHGISCTCFHRHYYKLAKKEIIRDNIVGQILFLTSHYFAQNKRLISFYATQIKKKSSFLGRFLLFFSWNMMTGEISYKNILQEIFFVRFHTYLQPDRISRLIRKKRKRLDILYRIKNKKKRVLNDK
ncbi:MAG: hypothetical protein GXO75_15535 [Calditrichaeota bacterium]|nr:hypothetical protein [Calditrichota bacterium]